MTTASNVAFLKASADHQVGRAETVEELAHVHEFHIFLPPLLPCPAGGCFSAFPRDAAIKGAQKLVGASCALTKGILNVIRTPLADEPVAMIEALVDLVVQLSSRDCRSRSRKAHEGPSSLVLAASRTEDSALLVTPAASERWKLSLLTQTAFLRNLDVNTSSWRQKSGILLDSSSTTPGGRNSVEVRRSRYSS